MSASADPAISAAVSLERARWAESSSTVHAAIADASSKIAALTSENRSISEAAALASQHAAETTALAVNNEMSARAAQYAAEARATAAERALAEEKAAREFAVHVALSASAPELERLQAAVRDKELECERLSDWVTDRQEASARETALRAELTAMATGRADDVAALERRNAADREGIRKLMMRHLLDFKKELLKHSANSLDDTTKRVITQHEQLLDELNFTSAHAQKLLLEVDETNRVRPNEANQTVQGLERSLKLTRDELASVYERNFALKSALRVAREALAAAGASNQHAAAAHDFGDSGPGLELGELDRAAAEADGTGLDESVMSFTNALPRRTPLPAERDHGSDDSMAVFSPPDDAAPRASPTAPSPGIDSSAISERGAHRTAVHFAGDVSSDSQGGGARSHAYRVNRGTPYPAVSALVAHTPAPTPAPLSRGAVRPLSLTFSPQVEARKSFCCDAARQLESALDSLLAVDEERRELASSSDSFLAALIEAAGGVRAELVRASSASAVERWKSDAGEAGEVEDLTLLTSSSLLARALDAVAVAEETVAACSASTPLGALLRAIAEVMRRVRSNAATQALVRVDSGADMGLRDATDTLRMKVALSKTKTSPAKGTGSPAAASPKHAALRVVGSATPLVGRRL